MSSEGPPVIIDTSVWVQYFNLPGSREHRQVRSLIMRGMAAMTAVVMAEVLQGARSDAQYRELADMLQGLRHLSTTERTGLIAGRIAYDLKKRGRTIPMTDVMIAATALEHGLEVFSRDEHFRRVPGLRMYQRDDSDS